MAMQNYGIFDSYKSFREFMTFSYISNSAAYLPPQSLHLNKPYDQDIVNKYMRKIVDHRIINPVFASSRTRVVLSGANEYQAYLQLNKMMPVLMVDVDTEEEFKDILSKYRDWCQHGGENSMSIDDWLKGIDYD